MPKKTAGLLMYRRVSTLAIEVLLIHPGGPFWARKDLGAWSIPKGEYLEDEAPLAAARREFEEETGFAATGHFLELGTVQQPGGKLVAAWAFEGDCDPEQMTSNTFKMEWPKGSGRFQDFPEADRAAWFSVAEAKRRILGAQAPLLDVLCSRLGLPSVGE